MDFENVKIAAREHIQAVTAIHPNLTLPRMLLSEEARSTSLESLVETLDILSSENHTGQLFEKIVVLHIYLANGHKKSDHEAAVLLRQWIAGAILPTQTFAELLPYLRTEKPVLSPVDITKFRAMSLSGLLLLARLQEIEPPSKVEHVVTILTCLASFTDLNDPWTCSEARGQAFLLLDDYVAYENLSTAMNGLLQERIKPIFIRSKDTVTADSDLDGETKPWKYSDAYGVTVFQWVLEHLDEFSVQANWPLIIPPLLTLIDDSSIKYKIKGCNFLAVFLRRCPSLLLERTGLGEIFENAVLPCLLSLPSLTKETESLEMLEAAYPVLISLALVRFPGGRQQATKVRALDKILRDGVLKGYAQAGDNVRIAKLLVDKMITLVEELGVELAKHLKARTYPALLQASVKAVQTIIVAVWPRIALHRGEILKGLTICWGRIRDEEAQCHELNAVRENIERAVQLLRCTQTRDRKLVDEYQALIDSDGRLQVLLVV